MVQDLVIILITVLLVSIAIMVPSIMLVIILMLSPFLYFGYAKWQQGESGQWFFSTTRTQVTITVERDKVAVETGAQAKGENPPQRLDRYA